LISILKDLKDLKALFCGHSGQIITKRGIRRIFSFGGKQQVAPSPATAFRF